MDSRTEEILTAFPALRYDPAFKITSRENPDYNCIAWAFGRNDCWMWPDEDADGVSLWPDPSADPEIQTFVEAFKKIGFEVCDDDGYEERTQKIALYCYVGTTECTHAARQLRNGLWTSKLGESNDIQHSSRRTKNSRRNTNPPPTSTDYKPFRAQPHSAGCALTAVFCPENLAVSELCCIFAANYGSAGDSLAASVADGETTVGNIGGIAK